MQLNAWPLDRSMTQRSLAEVLLAMLGIYFSVSAVAFLPLAMSIYQSEPDFLEAILGPRRPELGGFIALAASGMVLISGRRPLAERLFPPSEPHSSATTREDLQSVGFVVVGTYLVVNALSGVAAVAGYLFSRTQESSLASFAESTVGSWVTIAIGSALILGSGGISRTVEALRQGGKNSIRPR